ncbi:MAG: hypothetical protein P8179_20960 [Candidatus Thiodiazotropha sp.]
MASYKSSEGQKMNDCVKGVETLSKLLGSGKTDRITARFKELSPSFFKNEAISVVFGRTWSSDADEEAGLSQEIGLGNER